MVFPTISIAESFAYPTSMFLRNLLAMDTEEMIRAQPMDSVVLIGGCDKNLPAQVMAAASVDLPAIVVPTGPMLVGHHRGEVIGACTDCRRFWAQHRAGSVDVAEIESVSGRLCPTVGTCGVMGTASSMACVVEALGLSLPMSATAPATHADRLRIAEASGKRAAEMAIAGSPRPSHLITAASIRNACIVLQAIGGSTNALIHLTAIAGRAGVAFDLDGFDRLGREIPVLVNLKPSGAHYMEHFHYAGGIPALLRELAPRLDMSTPTVSGQTLSDSIAQAEAVPGQDVIRTLAAPLTEEGAMAILHGNLAPRGAVIKHSAASPGLLRHTGRAVVFDSLEDLASRIDLPDLEVAADDVLVLRNAGPKGGPGMPEAGYLPIPLRLARQGVRDMVRISDARMSGTAFGTIVLHIAPESAAGGPLAVVETGDRISLDVEARRIDLLIEESELKARLAARAPSNRPKPVRGYARLFDDHILQADEGCDFDFLRR
jgi:dihydroxy-acid dehydratase